MGGLLVVGDLQGVGEVDLVLLRFDRSAYATGTGPRHQDCPGQSHGDCRNDQPIGDGGARVRSCLAPDRVTMFCGYQRGDVVTYRLILGLQARCPCRLETRGGERRAEQIPNHSPLLGEKGEITLLGSRVAGVEALQARELTVYSGDQPYVQLVGELTAPAGI